MRFLLLILLFSLFSSPVQANDQKNDLHSEEEWNRIKFESLKNMPERLKATPEQKSVFTVKTFENGCFNKLNDPKKLKLWADRFLSPVPEEKSDQFRYNVSEKKGPVWYAIFPEGPIAMVLEEEPVIKCHVLGYEGDNIAFHKEMKNMAARTATNLPETTYEYKYLEKPKDNINQSVITVIFEHLGFGLTIFGTTITNYKQVNAQGPKMMLTIYPFSLSK